MDETSRDIAIVVCITIILSVAAIVFGQVARQAFGKEARTGAPKSLGLLLVRSQFLRLATVVAVILAVVLLALAGKLTEGAVALLSGVAGFVLGGAAQAGAEDASDSRTEPIAASDASRK